MALPSSPIARRYYRVAYQRLEEAQVLSRAGYHIGAIYLAGYAVECMLKTLILDATPQRRHREVEAEFRGQRAHQYEWLRNRYAQTKAAPIPPATNSALIFVSTWETSLRYTPGLGKPVDADRFMREVVAVLKWADSRI